jgi:Holliday junction resolvase RusA-like endonuclease|tara:strand:+ start:5506 stop:5895 length:390 start_codon:yes stop_codon:yes gene_type:complete
MAIDNLLELENMKWAWEATILGEPASKSNHRQIVRIGGKPRLIKSKKALSYTLAFSLQVPKITRPIEGDILMWCRIYYATRRPDLDESLIMDSLQAAMVIGNDRQIKAKVVLWALDRENPRAKIKLASM